MNENEYININRVTEAKGLKSNRSLRLEINKPESKYIAHEVKVNGGTSYEILYSSLEPEIQQKLRENSNKSTALVPLNYQPTSINAREFLKEVRKEFEFEITSIQVDGGSEFMGEFEEYCKKEQIKLYVLPPRSPKMNGYVERANETYRYEFWNVYEIPDTIEEARKLLKKYEYKYNCERMHQSLNYLTPMEY